MKQKHFFFVNTTKITTHKKKTKKQIKNKNKNKKFQIDVTATKGKHTYKGALGQDGAFRLNFHDACGVYFYFCLFFCCCFCFVLFVFMCLKKQQSVMGVKKILKKIETPNMIT